MIYHEENIQNFRHSGIFENIDYIRNFLPTWFWFGFLFCFVSNDIAARKWFNL